MKSTNRMECNKEEALRAKEIAEKKFMEMDVSGARRYALKAQSLYSALDGLSQFLQTLDVYISAEKRVNGEVDWYRVLGVEPFADDDLIRKRYRKLALILHPDKNKSVGADGAFKILSEAWSLLSDKAKRIVYDQKRNLGCMYERVPDGKSSMTASHNGFTNLFNSSDFNAKYQMGAAIPKRTWTPEPLKSTFWTVCNSCKMHFEYLRAYLNYSLVCPNCHKPFKAYELPPPMSFHSSGSSTSWNSYMQRQNSCPRTMVKNQNAAGNRPSSASNARQAGFSASVSSKKTFQSGAFPKSRGVAGVPLSSSAAQATGVFQPTSEPFKRGVEDAVAAPLTEEANSKKNHATKKTGSGFQSSDVGSTSVQKGERPKKKRRMDEYKMDNKGREMAKQRVMEKVHLENASGSQNVSFETLRTSAAGNHRPNVSRELEMRNRLMEKARREIRKKLNEWRSASISNPSHKPKTSDEVVGEKGTGEKKPAVNGVKARKCREFVHTDYSVNTKMSSPANSNGSSDTNSFNPMSMSVPDPDFHDFDEDRTEKAFSDNQVWAAYDNDDGMPRYYAMIHSVISRKPFKMRISWLNSKSNDELAPLKWIDSGFYKTSGDFRIGKYKINRSLNSFSHKVKWTKGTRGAIQIYPVKGDVWALYRNWSPDWNELTPDEVIHKYDMVEVLEDYNEERGVTVVPLVKVAGFRAVFQRNLDAGKIMMIPRAEMFRFSHQVPSYLLTGKENQNVPKGCWELDPAATPLELLHAEPDAKKEEMVDNADNVGAKDPFGSMQQRKEEERVENGKMAGKEGLVGDIERKVLAEMTIKGKKLKEGKMLVYKRRRLREGKMLGSAK